MSRAARCWSSWTTSTLALLALTGCGSPWHAAFDAHGAGKDQHWVVPAKGRPKAVVVLLPWQVHLAERGYDVIYDLSPAAKRAIWDRTDRLIERAIP